MFISDFTATTIIEGFRDQVAGEGMERVLQNLVVKKFAEHKAVSGSSPFYGYELISEQGAYPSWKQLHQPIPFCFQTSQVSHLTQSLKLMIGDKPTLPENPSQGDQTLDLAFDALTAQDYAHSLSFTNEAIEQGVSSKEGQAEAYNLRGTFRYGRIASKDNVGLC